MKMKEIGTDSPYQRLLAIFLQPLVSNYLFMQISGGKLRLLAVTKSQNRCYSPIWTSCDFLTATSLELKLNRETPPLTEANCTPGVKKILCSTR